MAEYTVLSWQNENSLSSYPLVFPLDYDGFIVDASFIQFDYFIPILNSIFIGIDYIDVTITFDSGELKKTYSNIDFYDGVREIRFIENNDRYLGCITVGEGTTYLWENFVGQELIKNIPFLPTVVKSIPLKDAVYTLDSVYGDITFDVELEETVGFTNIGGYNFENNLVPGLIFQNTGGGENIFYNYNLSKNALVFNAVANHKLPEDGVWALKRINLVPPIDNNLFLASNDLIKFRSINNQKLEIALAGENTTGASIVPTLTS